MTPLNANTAEMEVMNKVGAKLRELGLYTFVSWSNIFIPPPLTIDEGLSIISQV
jgi:taurine--2-oxoglutarate transaminase